jgi:hypothetical protein
MVGNPRGGGARDKRRLLIGRTDGGRPLMLVIERSGDPTTWLIVTGWESTQAERKIQEARQRARTPGQTPIQSPATSTSISPSLILATSRTARAYPRRSSSSSSASRAKTPSDSSGSQRPGARLRRTSWPSCFAKPNARSFKAVRLTVRRTCARRPDGTIACECGVAPPRSCRWTGHAECAHLMCGCVQRRVQPGAESRWLSQIRPES